jgi:hypothetical protein
VGRNSRPIGGKAGGDGRIVVSPRVAKNRSSLLILRLCLLQILVRNIDLEFQFIELRVFKYRPPVPTKILVIGLGGLPVRGFFIRGWSRRPLVYGSLDPPRIQTLGRRVQRGPLARVFSSCPRPKYYLEDRSFGVSRQTSLNDLDFLPRDN